MSLQPSLKTACVHQTEGERIKVFLPDVPHLGLYHHHLFKTILPCDTDTQIVNIIHFIRIYDKYVILCVCVLLLQMVLYTIKPSLN